MPKDNREVLQNIRLPKTKTTDRRTLTIDDADEIADMYSQDELDSLVKRGVLSGDWKAGGKKKADKK